MRHNVKLVIDSGWWYMEQWQQITPNAALDPGVIGKV